MIQQNTFGGHVILLLKRVATMQLPIRVGRVIINDDDHVNAPNSHSVATSGSNLVE